jgi:hypothetical protein
MVAFTHKEGASICKYSVAFINQFFFCALRIPFFQFHFGFLKKEVYFPMYSMSLQETNVSVIPAQMRNVALWKI